MRAGCLLLALTIACHDSTLYISPPWGPNRTAVVVEGPVDGPPRQVVAVPPATPLVLDVVHLVDSVDEAVSILLA